MQKARHKNNSATVQRVSYLHSLETGSCYYLNVLSQSINFMSVIHTITLLQQINLPEGRCSFLGTSPFNIDLPRSLATSCIITHQWTFATTAPFTTTALLILSN